MQSQAAGAVDTSTSGALRAMAGRPASSGRASLRPSVELAGQVARRRPLALAAEFAQGDRRGHRDRDGDDRDRPTGGLMAISGLMGIAPAGSTSRTCRRDCGGTA